jgi:hypothetical protein
MGLPAASETSCRSPSVPLSASLLAVSVAILTYRWFFRGEKGPSLDAFADEALD